MAEDITRIIEVDASASVQTVRELQNEVAALNKELQSLKEGTTEYAAAQQQAAQKQQQLSAAFEISRESAEDIAVSAERLAEIAAEDQKAIAGVVEAMRAMGDAGTGANGVLQNSADTLGVVTESTRQQTAAVSELEQQQNALIQQAVQEAGILSEVSNQRKALNKAISDGTINEEGAVRMKEQLLKVETTYKASLSETQATLKATTKQMQAAAGSYDQMSQQLGQLRNDYRQMGKAARESTSGQQMIRQIKALDKELKALDASMGNYQRTVGGYEEALRAVLPAEASQLVTLGKTIEKSGGVTQAFGLMTAAVGRMAKAAWVFIATPLGATLTALAAAGAAAFALFNAHNKKVEEQAEATAKALDKQKEKMKEVVENIDYTIKLLRAQGKESEANAMEMQKYSDAVIAAKNAYETFNAQYEKMGYRRKKANYDNLLNLYNTWKAAEKAQENYLKSVSIANAAEEKSERDKNAKLAEERRKAADERKNAAIEANAELQNTIAMMNAELGAGTEEGDIALAQEKYRQELEAFNTMVTEKGITEANAMAYREALIAEHEARVADIRQTYRNAEFNALMTELDKELEATFQAGKKALAEEEKNRKNREKIDDALVAHKRKTVQQTGVLLEAGAQLAGESTAVGKAMAVAAATISTYQAAQAAYQSAFMPVPTVASPYLGAINMAAAIASGLANVKSILSVDSSGGTGYGSGSVGTTSTPAIVTPPAVIQEVPIVRSLTGASEEERLNQMASDQRVYLVYSDVEQAGRQVRVQQSETSF